MLVFSQFYFVVITYSVYMYTHACIDRQAGYFCNNSLRSNTLISLEFIHHNGGNMH